MLLFIYVFAALIVVLVTTSVSKNHEKTLESVNLCKDHIKTISFDINCYIVPCSYELKGKINVLSTSLQIKEMNLISFLFVIPHILIVPQNSIVDSLYWSLNALCIYSKLKTYDSRSD